MKLLVFCQEFFDSDSCLMDGSVTYLEQTCVVLTLQLIPSVAIGFAAYDSVKIWLLVPARAPRERKT